MRCSICKRQLRDEEIMGKDFYLFKGKEKGLSSLKEGKAVCVSCIQEIGTDKVQQLMKVL